MEKMRDLRAKAKMAWENAIERFQTVEGLNDLERHTVNNYMIASESFHDYLSDVEPSRKRKMKAWSAVLYLLGCFFTSAMLVYYDDDTLYLLFGFPSHLLGNTRIFVLILMIECFIPAFFKLVI